MDLFVLETLSISDIACCFVEVKYTWPFIIIKYWIYWIYISEWTGKTR